MSSLQKFHRRTNGKAPVVQLIGMEAPVAGAGFWLGTAGDGVSKMYVAPKSSEAPRLWGSYGAVRGTTSTTDGVANTNTLYAFGSAAHPAAYYTKTLTTGGYTTWYLPARNELNTMWTNHLAVPFATNDSFSGNYYWSSTERSGAYAYGITFTNGSQYSYSSNKYSGSPYTVYVRAVRKSTI